MELFTIQCTTCRARLRVNDASVIGDILACPKCGSMVQVAPPPDWQNPDAPAGERAVASKTPAPTVRQEAKKAAAVPPMLPQRGAPSIPAASVPPLPKPKAATTINSPVAPTIAVSAHVAAAATTIPTAPSQLSALTAQLPHDWKLLAGGLAAGISLGLGAWLAIVMLTRAPEAPEVAQAQGNSPAVSMDAATQPSRHRAEISIEPIEETVVAEESSETEQGAAEESTATPTAAAGVARPVAPAIEENKQTEEPAPRETISTPPGGIKLEPAAREPVAPQEPPKASVAAGDDAALPDDAAPRSAAARDESATEDSSGALPARALTSEEIDERLSGPLPKVRFVKVPLAQFVEFINDFSGLTVVIDDRALAKVSKNRETPVTVKLADTTARDALRSAVNSLGLTCVVRDGQLVVTAVSK